MKFIEYVYLGVALLLVCFLALSYSAFGGLQVGVTISAIVITSFMYSFRRNQRRIMEKRELEDLENSVKEDK